MKYLFYIVITALAVSCTDGGDASGNMADAQQSISDILSPEPPVNPYDSHVPEAPDDGCVRLPLRFTGPLKNTFNDSNHVHLSAAQAVGFAPITCDRDIMHLRRPLVRIKSCKDYYLDNLTHSFPYLVPEAATLLSDIGRSFNDTLQARGGGDYRIKVTSVLRTPATVRRLRRVNRNATEESTHSYGTTFDISYSKFICDDTTGTHRTFEDLKNLLAEILYRLRSEGRCYVKYEVKQSCFHITVRPDSIP